MAPRHDNISIRQALLVNSPASQRLPTIGNIGSFNGDDLQIGCAF